MSHKFSFLKTLPLDFLNIFYSKLIARLATSLKIFQVVRDGQMLFTIFLIFCFKNNLKDTSFEIFD